MLKEEENFGIKKFKTYKEFGEKVYNIRNNVLKNIEKLKIIDYKTNDFNAPDLEPPFDNWLTFIPPTSYGRDYNVAAKRAGYMDELRAKRWQWSQTQTWQARIDTFVDTCRSRNLLP